MLHDKMRLQKDFLPPGLTFEQFWARMKHYSRKTRVLEYLYGQQNKWTISNMNAISQTKGTASNKSNTWSNGLTHTYSKGTCQCT